MIIIPLDDDFGRKSQSDQNAIVAELQAAAYNAGLAGTVVPVWRTGSSHSYIAPRPWHPFFKTLGWNQIIASLNKVLTIN